MKRNIVHSLTVANWNGIDFKTLNYHATITHLVGHTGAGKTTLMIAHITAMMPDKRLLRFKNTTETSSNPFDKGDKGLYGRIGASGACYSVIDYRLTNDERVLIGVQLRRKTEPEIELNPFHIAGLPLEIDIKDLFLVTDFNQTIYVAEKNELRNNAATYGSTVEWYSKSSDYLNFLFEKRIIPKRMRQHEDRKQYYRLLETSLYGGISSEIQQRLRDYLLASDSTVQSSVSSMQNALKESQRTRQKIEATQKHRDFISHTYQNAQMLGAATLVSEELKSTTARKKAAEAKSFFKQCEATWLNLKMACGKLSTLKDKLAEQVQRASDALTKATDYDRKAKEVKKLQDKITKTQAEISKNKELLGKKQQQLEKNQSVQQSLDDKVKQLEKAQEELNAQLADAQQAYSIEAQHLGLYRQAQKSLREAQQILPNRTLNQHNVKSVRVEIEQAYQTTLKNTTQLQTQLDLATTRANEFQQAYQLLSLLSEQPVTAKEAFRLANQLDDVWRDKEYRVKHLDEFSRRVTELENLERRQLDIKAFVQQFHAEVVITTEQGYQNYQQDINRQADTCRQYERDYLRQQDEVKRQLEDAEDKEKQQTAILPQWQLAQDLRDTLIQELERQIHHESDILEAQTMIQQSLTKARDAKRIQTAERDSLRDKIINLEQTGSKEISGINSMKEQIGGALVADFLEDISIEEAPLIEAKYGPLCDAVIVSDVKQAAKNMAHFEKRPDQVWLIEGNIDEESFAEDDYLTDEGTYFDSILVKMGNVNRLSRLPTHPIICAKARQNEVQRLRTHLNVLQDGIENQTVLINKFENLEKTVQKLWSVAHCLSLPDPSSKLKQIESEKKELIRLSTNLERQIRANAELLEKFEKDWQALNANAKNAGLLDRTTLAEEVLQARDNYQSAYESQVWLKQHGNDIQRLRTIKGSLETLPPKNLEQLRQDFENASQAVKTLSHQRACLDNLCANLPHFKYADAESNIKKKSGFQEELQGKLGNTKTEILQARSKLELIRSAVSTNEKAIAGYDATLKQLNENLFQLQQEMKETGITYSPTLLKEASEKLKTARKQYKKVTKELTIVTNQLSEQERLLDKKQFEIDKAKTSYQEKSQIAIDAICCWRQVKREAQNLKIAKWLKKPEYSQQSVSSLEAKIIEARANLSNQLQNHEDADKILAAITRASTENQPINNLWVFFQTYQYLLVRLNRELAQSDDLLKAIQTFSDSLIQLAERLKAQEEEFRIKSKDVINLIQRNIKRERKRIQNLNQGLKTIRFGRIGSISIKMETLETFIQVLNALRDDKHTDLFSNHTHTIEDAFAEIYKRETGGTIKGEQMLDYRNYVRLQIEVQRQGCKKYEIANPTNLSTGEAIGTGLSVLIMVLQSWEENTQKNEGRGKQSSRILFLDEAARLDSKSISTLIELCDKMELQLLIAAPNVAHLEKCITHKLVRKNINGTDRVIIICLKGSGSKIS